MTDLSCASDTETWRPVVGYEGRYEVSDHGRVRSLDRYARTRSGQRRVPGSVLNPWLNGPYPTVSLSAENRVVQRAVHTLVLTAFVGPRPDEQECLHADDTPTHNHLHNLRWGTGTENAADMRRNGRGNRFYARTTCKWGHRLGEPNVTGRGRRGGFLDCLACARGAARVSSANRSGVELDFRTEADLCYARIMAGETGRAPRRWRKHKV